MAARALSVDVAARSLELITSSVQRAPVIKVGAFIDAHWSGHAATAKAVCDETRRAHDEARISHDECRAGKFFQPLEVSRCIRSLR
jgi:hypothetical protein